MASTNRARKTNTKTNTRGSGQRGGRRRAKPKPDMNARWSILLFGIGVLVFALIVVPGASVWNWVRTNILFGVFGVGSYVLAPMLLYIAVLVACERPVKGKLAKALLVLMLVLAIHSFTLSGAKDGLAFYLIPDLSKISGTMIVKAMNQAFFTLSVGMGGMAIFGSYIGKERSLLGESVNIIVLDTFVAVVAGMIMFPACDTYNLEVTAGPSLLFDTMASVFNHMQGGRWWGALFFLFMVFAAMSTVFGVCENLLAMIRELTGWSRPVGCIVCGIGTFLVALPTALGYSLIRFQPFAKGTAWLDLWDFIVSNNAMPLGSLILALFCCTRRGWGWNNFLQEANAGKGLKIKAWMKPLFCYFVPVGILFIYIYGMFTFPWH